MKKTYINPEMLVVKMATQQMLAASENLGHSGDYGTGSGITLGAHEDDTEW